MTDIFERIAHIGIVPVVKIDSVVKAVPLAKALIDGGIPCAEITFRTAAAAESIRAMRNSYPAMLVGAGTVINVELAKKAIAAGAQFIVSPGFNPNVVDYCISQQVPVIPGINNPSGIEAALERNLQVLKFFPAEVSGGTAMLEAFSGPFAQVSFMVTGGIDMKNMGEYAKRKNVCAIGGSWMVKADLIEGEKWAQISALSREAVTAVHGFSFAHVGINQSDSAQAAQTAALFVAFGFMPKEGNSSIFSGSAIEVMKSPLRGACGHIGINTWNIERSLSYLAEFGFRAVSETARYGSKKSTNPADGALCAIYIDGEIGGFAVHLVKA